MTSVEAPSHWCRSRASPKRRAFSIATPAVARQCLDELLVLLGEGLGTGPGEIEAAVVLLADPDGYAEERTHQRVTLREAHGYLVRGDVVHPDRLLLLEHQPEQATSLREVGDPSHHIVGHPDMDESLEDTLVPDDAQRSVVGPDQLHGCLDDPAQHHGQVEVGDDGAVGLEQCPEPAPRDVPLIRHPPTISPQPSEGDDQSRSARGRRAGGGPAFEASGGGDDHDGHR